MMMNLQYCTSLFVDAEAHSVKNPRSPQKQATIHCVPKAATVQKVLMTAQVVADVIDLVGDQVVPYLPQAEAL